MSEVVVWQPQVGPQTALVTCPVFEVFFGGARGGGKTDGMLGEWLSHAQDYGDGAIGLMVRRTRTELVETIERSKVLYTPLGAKFHEQDKMWRMPNGARLRFAYLERDSDADAYQGHSYTRVYVEEAGTFPSEKPILKLIATLRSGAGVPVGIRLTGNPGGPGHNWVRARYIDPAPHGMQILTSEFKNPWTGEKLARERVYIPSKLQDNRYLGGDYVAGLQMVGSETLVKAWLEGDWSVIEGAFFDCWSTERHVVRPFEIPGDWLRFRSMDWGSAAPFSVGWWAVVPDLYVLDNGKVLPRGCMVRYREWYGAKSPNVGLKLTNEEVARGIKMREADEKVTYGVLDPSAFAVNGGPSIAQQYAKEGVFFREADNRMVSQLGPLSGWAQFRSRLVGDEEGRPMMVVFSTCRDFIRTVPAIQHDQDKPERVDTDGEDHAADEARYGCMSRPWIPVKAQEKRPVEPEFRAGPDGTMVMKGFDAVAYFNRKAKLKKRA
jgi:hypothetical protein